ncbi:sensor histidine kinase [Bacillus solimangrovi]|nr:ATP-binding protein [Bacillus solimangrovi]
MTLISIINLDVYSYIYLLQWMINISLLTLAIVKNNKRVLFFLKNGYQNLVRSFLITIVPFMTYVIYVNKGNNIFTNLTFYFISIFPLYSIYLIVKQTKKEIKIEEQLNSKNKIILSFIIIIFLLIIGNLLNVNTVIYFIIAHSILWFNTLYFSLVYNQVKNSILNGTEKQQYSYINTINQIINEEQLRKDFSIYLHDEILQDILAVKNIVNKADKVEIREMIVDTLNELSKSIRRQTEEYHPTILRTLTLKENYSNLIENTKQNFGAKHICTSFICKKDIFLLEPYNLIVYRFIKELTTNSFKHSQGDHIRIYLYQEMEEVELIVEDNGEGEVDLINLKKGHKGLFSIIEQVNMLGGKIDIKSNKPTGLKVRIQLIMKGDYSYEHFINR